MPVFDNPSGDGSEVIRWKGYDEKDDSWEPLTNLAGIEQDVAAFESKKRKEAIDFGEAMRARARAARAKALAVVSHSSQPDESASASTDASLEVYGGRRAIERK